MNILMMTLLYPEDDMEETLRNIRDKMQYQINNYQRAFEKGIRVHLRPKETLSLLNCLPVGIFPFQYRKLFLRGGERDQHTIRSIFCINLPWIKQRMRYLQATRKLKKWVLESADNRTVLIYTQYLPYMKAITKIKKRFPDVKATLIVTDLPKEWGLASGRTGLFKRLEDRFADQSLKLSRGMDGYVLLTEPMAEILHVQNKPYIVLEGLISENEKDEKTCSEQERFTVLYTGTLEPDLGIEDLLKAFERIPEADLWICGQGSMGEYVRAYAKRCKNIYYYGFVTQNEALDLQARATALINPRQPNGMYTKYSFPSKTLEYLRSGKPVLCYRLEGIPRDYDPYLLYIQQPGCDGICQAIRRIMVLSSTERTEIGRRGKDYVMMEKNPHIQCEKLMALLRGL